MFSNCSMEIALFIDVENDRASPVLLPGLSSIVRVSG